MKWESRVVTTCVGLDAWKDDISVLMCCVSLRLLLLSLFPFPFPSLNLAPTPTREKRTRTRVDDGTPPQKKKSKFAHELSASSKADGYIQIYDVDPDGRYIQIKNTSEKVRLARLPVTHLGPQECKEWVMVEKGWTLVALSVQVMCIQCSSSLSIYLFKLRWNWLDSYISSLHTHASCIEICCQNVCLFIGNQPILHPLFAMFF